MKCPRCGVDLRVCSHDKIGQKQLNQPFYYRRWYHCDNRACKTTMVMREEDKIFSSTQAQQNFRFVVRKKTELAAGEDVVMDVLNEDQPNWLSDAEHKAQTGPPPWE